VINLSKSGLGRTPVPEGGYLGCYSPPDPGAADLLVAVHLLTVAALELVGANLVLELEVVALVLEVEWLRQLGAGVSLHRDHDRLFLWRRRPLLSPIRVITKEHKIIRPIPAGHHYCYKGVPYGPRYKWSRRSKRSYNWSPSLSSCIPRCTLILREIIQSPERYARSTSR